MHRIITASALLLLAGCGLSPSDKLKAEVDRSEDVRKASGYYECMDRLHDRDARYEKCVTEQTPNFSDRVFAEAKCRELHPRLDITEATCDRLFLDEELRQNAQ